MNIISFYSKEIYLKIIYLIILSIIIIVITILKSKYILLFILSPIKKIKTSIYILQFSNINKEIQEYTDYNTNKNEYIPIIEINIPFITTSYIYLKYITLFLIYIIIPILLYIFYISVRHILKERENNNLFSLLLVISIFLIYNILITHYIIVPIFINFIYSHYYEFLSYEFDIEFQLLFYLNMYFYILYFNCFLFIINIIKKYLKINKIANYLFIICLLIFPIDIVLQIIYIFIYLNLHVISTFFLNIKKNTKKYKQMEYLETK